MRDRLKNYSQIQFLINDIELMLYDIEFNILGVGAISYDERIASTIKTSIVEKQCNEIQRLKYELAKLKTEQSRMENAFKILSVEEFDIIDKLYIKKISVADVARQKNLEYSTLLKRAKKIIGKLERFFKFVDSI